MRFNYHSHTTMMGEIEVEDPFNCALTAFNDMGEEFILVTSTNLGTTKMFSFGPVVPDMDTLPKKVNCTFERVSSAPSKVYGFINKWISSNSKFNPITQMIETTREAALSDCVDIMQYMDDDNKY